MPKLVKPIFSHVPETVFAFLLENPHPELLGSLAHPHVESGERQSFSRSKIDVRGIVSGKAVVHCRRRSVPNYCQGGSVLNFFDGQV